MSRARRARGRWQRHLPLPRPLGGLALAFAATAAAQTEPRLEPDAPQPEEGPVLELTLQDAVRLALESNLDLEVEELATERAYYDSVGSWGAFDPVLFVEGSLTDREAPGVSTLTGATRLSEDTQALTTRLTVPVQTGGQLDLSLVHTNERTNNQFATFDVSTTDVFTASLTQPLLRGGWRRYATSNQREAEVSYQLQLERERQVRHQLLRDVYDAYWDLVSAREELAVRELAIELGREQRNQDQRRLDVGAGTEVDVLQSETNLAVEQELWIQADFALRAAEDNLRRMLFQQPEEGADEFLATWDVPIRPLSPLPDVDAATAPQDELDWLASLQVAVQRRPELAQERLSIDAAEIQLQRARSERLPQLDLDLSAQGVGFDSDPSDAFSQATSFDFPEYRGALTFSLPIGNRTASNAERGAWAALRSARLSYDRRELDVLAEVRAAVRDVRYRRESVLAARTSLELAQRQLDAERARRDIGLSTTFQVLEFQQELARALSAERAARSAYAKSWAALAQAQGSLETAPPFLERWGQDEGE